MKIIRESNIKECIEAWGKHEIENRKNMNEFSGINSLSDFVFLRWTLIQPIKPEFKILLCKLEEKDMNSLMNIKDKGSWSPKDEKAHLYFKGSLKECTELIKNNQLKHKIELKELYLEPEKLDGIVLFQKTDDEIYTILEGNNRLVRMYNLFGDKLYEKMVHVFLIKGQTHPFAR